MSYYTKVGYFTLQTSKNPGDTHPVTGLGFKPKLLFFWELMGSNTWVNANTAYCYGFANDVGETGLVNGRIFQNGSGTSDSDRRLMLNKGCISLYDYTVATNYDNESHLVTLKSMDSDGFTLEYLLKSYEVADRTYFLAIGGDELKQTKIGVFDYPSATGSFSITDVGFKSDLLMIYNLVNTHKVETLNNTYLSMGWASAPNRQSVISCYNQSGVGISNTSRYAYWGDIMGCSSSSSVVARASLTKFDKNGFTLNKTSGTSGKALYVAIKGGRYRVGYISTRTDTSDITETIGYRPGAILFASANMPQSSPSTQTSDAKFSFGGASSDTDRSSHGIYIPNGLDWCSVSRMTSWDSVYINRITGSGRMDLKSIENTGFTCVMDSVDSAQNYVQYVTFSTVASGTSQQPAYVLGGGQSLLPDGDVYADSWTNSASGTTVLYPYLRDSNASTYVTYVNIPVGSGTFEVSLANPQYVVESGEWYLEYMAHIKDGSASGLIQVELLQGSTPIASGITIIGYSSAPALNRYYLTHEEKAKVPIVSGMRMRVTILGIK